MEVSIRFKVAL